MRRKRRCKAPLTSRRACARAAQVDKEKIDLKNPVDSADYDRRTPLHLAARRAPCAARGWRGGAASSPGPPRAAAAR